MIIEFVWLNNCLPTNCFLLLSHCNLFGDKNTSIATRSVSVGLGGFSLAVVIISIWQIAHELPQIDKHNHFFCHSPQWRSEFLAIMDSFSEKHRQWWQQHRLEKFRDFNLKAQRVPTLKKCDSVVCSRKTRGPEDTECILFSAQLLFLHLRYHIWF